MVLQTTWNTSSVYTPRKSEPLPSGAPSLKVTILYPCGIVLPYLTADEVELVCSELRPVEYVRWSHTVVSNSALTLSYRQSSILLLSCQVPLAGVEPAPIGLEGQWLDPQARGSMGDLYFEGYPIPPIKRASVSGDSWEETTHVGAQELAQRLTAFSLLKIPNSML